MPTTCGEMLSILLPEWKGHAESGSINISQSTYERVKDFFDCEPRGEVEVKNMGSMQMYYVKRIKEEFSEDDEGYNPNRLFVREYNLISRASSAD